MGYQSFPWAEGDSNSMEKLESLHLPTLAGKRVLDIGCNEGFFCGWAKFNGATYVWGIDTRATFLETAEILFPDCDFQCQSWDDLDDSSYDVILFLSAIHYAKDQEATIHFLMDHLEAGGCLVLELGIAPGLADQFIEVHRLAGDVCLYPTVAKMHSMLSRYSYTYVGPSVNQEGDQIPRHVYHIMHRTPPGESHDKKAKAYQLELVRRFRALQILARN